MKKSLRIPSAPVSAFSARLTHGILRRQSAVVQRHAAQTLFWMSCILGSVFALTLPLWWLALGLCFEGDACREGHLLSLMDDVVGLFLSGLGIAVGRAWTQRLDGDSPAAAELEAEFFEGVIPGSSSLD